MVEGIPLAEEVEQLLEQMSPEELDDVERAAARLAEAKRRAERVETNESGDVTAATRAEKGVPAKASVVVKTINDNKYEYWQWRDGDKVRSQYKGPAEDG